MRMFFIKNVIKFLLIYLHHILIEILIKDHKKRRNIEEETDVPSHTCLVLLLLIRIGRYLIVIDRHLFGRSYVVVRLINRLDLISTVRRRLQFGVISQQRLQHGHVRLIIFPIRNIFLIIFQSGLRVLIVLQHRILIVIVRRITQIISHGTTYLVAELALLHLRANIRKY